MVKNLPAVWETWVQSLGWEDLLEKGMATHSNILAWRIPRTVESGGLQSMGSQQFMDYSPQGLYESQAGIKIAMRNMNNLRYADDTTLMAESKKELKSFLMKVKYRVKKLA